jgi:glycosyltransferase involved in cell wall biosynthesis/SAM-dependent methyltransferase
VTFALLPLVSVITIFFNGVQFLPEAIESVLAQTYDTWELFLVDDGSTDGSTGIALGYAALYPAKVHYLEHAGHQNRGMSATRNLGLHHARGTYIAFLDADDVWLPHKLERQVALLEAYPQAAMVYGATQYWYSWTGEPQDHQRDYIPALGIETERVFEPPSLLPLLYPLGQAAAPCNGSLLVRREASEAVGGFEETFRGMYEDQAFLVKIYLQHAVFVSSDFHDRYRIHSTSCMAMTKQAGNYRQTRRDFLDWFETYLSRQAVQHPCVWFALQQALAPYRQPQNQSKTPRPASRASQWQLRVAEGNEATLCVPAPDHGIMRVAIGQAATSAPFDIQLNQPLLTIRGHQEYVLRFLVRADSPRSICFGLARAHAPWTDLGLYRQIDLTGEWQSFQAEFCATADEDNARILFDVGAHGIAVEVSAVCLRSLHDGYVIEPEPPAPEVEFGTLRRVTPLSRQWGLDRGAPIDRYYVERFLAAHANDIQGRVLEIEDAMYTRKFGGHRVIKSDVLHVTEGNPRATIVGDLSNAAHIPSGAFDCVILTQTLHLIYDTRAVLKTLYRILKPGGVLLSTFPGITRVSHDEWAGSWYWSFTRASAERLFAEAFLEDNIDVQAHGNVLAAVAFLHGLAMEELQPEEVSYHDPDYEVLITVRAVKRVDGPPPLYGRKLLQQVTRRLRRHLHSQALILMYHRASTLDSDPWAWTKS